MIVISLLFISCFNVIAVTKLGDTILAIDAVTIGWSNLFCNYKFILKNLTFQNYFKLLSNLNHVCFYLYLWILSIIILINLFHPFSTLIICMICMGYSCLKL